MANMTDIHSYFESKPPRCINAYSAEQIALDAVSFDGHGGDCVNAGYSLTCKCGSKQHLLSGYIWENQDYGDVVTVSPITTECCMCSEKNTLFDSEIHGYDAELGHGASTARAEGTPGTLECAHHPERRMEVLVRFEFPTDLLDGDFEDWKGREQELFTWFTVYGRCSKCSEIWTLAELECA